MGKKLTPKELKEITTLAKQIRAKKGVKSTITVKKYNMKYTDAIKQASKTILKTDSKTKAVMSKEELVKRIVLLEELRFPSATKDNRSQRTEHFLNKYTSKNQWDYSREALEIYLIQLLKDLGVKDSEFSKNSLEILSKRKFNAKFVTKKDGSAPCAKARLKSKRIARENKKVTKK